MPLLLPGFNSSQSDSLFCFIFYPTLDLGELPAILLDLGEAGLLLVHHCAGEGVQLSYLCSIIRDRCDEYTRNDYSHIVLI